MHLAITRSPTLTPRAPGPTATTSPMPSWPIVIGRMGSWLLRWPGSSSQSPSRIRPARIERRAVDARDDDQVLVALEARGQGQQHLALVEDVDVLVEGEGVLDAEVRGQRGEQGRLAQPLDRVAELQVDVERAAP